MAGNCHIVIAGFYYCRYLSICKKEYGRLPVLFFTGWTDDVQWFTDADCRYLSIFGTQRTERTSVRPRIRRFAPRRGRRNRS